MDIINLGPIGILLCLSPQILHEILFVFLSYLTLVDTILKFEKMNLCIIDKPEILSLATQNCMQEPRVQCI